MMRFVFLGLALLIPLPAESLFAGEWPEILGPRRDGVARDEQWPDNWPTDSPAEAWSVPVGSGVAGAAIARKTAFLFHRQEDREIIEARDLQSGELKWKESFPTTYQPRKVHDYGPLCVPTIAGDAVILYGASGGLHCLEFESGKVRWSRNPLQEYGADEGYFGAGSAPLVHENLVLVNVGGFREDAGVVAFEIKSGETVWKAGTWKPSYAAPVKTEIDGEPVVIFCTRLETVGLKPKTGEVLFQTPFGARGPTVNGATPVVLDSHLFLTASYNIGNVWAKFDADSIEVLRKDLTPLASQYTTPVPVNGFLVGIDGRQDGPPGDLVCFDPASGKEQWREASFGYATLIRTGDFLLIMKTDGELVIAAADETKYNEKARYSLLTGTTRALPALAEGHFVIRNEDKFACFQLMGE